MALKNAKRPINPVGNFSIASFPAPNGAGINTDAPRKGRLPILSV
jgi:hypothetical protein